MRLGHVIYEKEMYWSIKVLRDGFLNNNLKKKSFFRLITLLKAPKRVVVTNLSTIPQFIRGFN